MGHSHSPLFDSCFFKVYDINQWELIVRGSEKIWRNKIKKFNCLPYKIPNTLSIEDLQKYQFRYLHGYHLVKVINIIRMKEDSLLTSSCNNIILIEYIVARLSDIKVLNFIEALLILKEAFRGFSLLFSFYRIFEIQPEMICFNEEGMVKVWLNKQLNLNHLNNKKQTKKENTNHKLQLKIQILKVFRMVEQKLQNQFNNHFLSGISGLQTFIDASQFIQSYIKLNNIKISSHLNLQQLKFKKNNKDIKYNNINHINTDSRKKIKQYLHNDDIPQQNNPLVNYSSFNEIQKQDKANKEKIKQKETQKIRKFPNNDNLQKISKQKYKYYGLRNNASKKLINSPSDMTHEKTLPFYNKNYKSINTQKKESLNFYTPKNNTDHIKAKTIEIYQPKAQYLKQNHIYQCPEEISFNQRDQFVLNQTIVENLKILQQQEDSNSSPIKILKERTVESDVQKMEDSEQFIHKLTQIKIQGLFKERSRRQTLQFRTFVQQQSYDHQNLRKERQLSIHRQIQKKTIQQFQRDYQQKREELSNKKKDEKNFEDNYKNTKNIQQSHETFYTNNDPYGINAKYEKYISHKNSINTSYYPNQQSDDQVKLNTNQKNTRQKKPFFKAYLQDD